MNAQQQIGNANLVNEAQRLASCGAPATVALHEAIRPFSPGAHQLRAIANWARTFTPPDGCDDRGDYARLADDCEALARWVDGSL